VLVSSHAHGFVVQTMSDLGIVGLVTIALLALAWLWAAVRAVGLLPPRGWRRWDGERVALTALALTALVFGLHSAIDWTWFVPGPAVMAVAAAGAVAGRSYLASTRPVEAAAGGLGPRPRYALAAAAGLVALACAWAVWQPQRSDAETNRSLDLLAARHLPAAAHAADHAGSIDPLSPDPLLAAASVASARGDTNGALALLQRAIRRFPGEPQVWVRLAEYQLDTLAKPADAERTILGALKLDPNSRAAQQVYLEARRKLHPTAPPTTTLPGATPPGGAPAKPPRPATPAPPTRTPSTPGPTPGRPVVPPAPAAPKG
jgi:tetratricopeptide (TPR) repeat protein